MQAGFRPEENRDFSFYWIFAGWENCPQSAAVRRLQSQTTGPATRYAHVPSDGSQNAACPNDLLTVGSALHPITLVEDGWFKGGIFPGNSCDRTGRHTCDGSVCYTDLKVPTNGEGAREVGDA